MLGKLPRYCWVSLYVQKPYGICLPNISCQLQAKTLTWKTAAETDFKGYQRLPEPVPWSSSFFRRALAATFLGRDARFYPGAPGLSHCCVLPPAHNDPYGLSFLTVVKSKVSVICCCRPFSVSTAAIIHKVRALLFYYTLPWCNCGDYSGWGWCSRLIFFALRCDDLAIFEPHC